MQPIKYESPNETADRWQISRQQVMKYLKDGRIPGANPITDAEGNILKWQIPVNSEKPEPRKPGRNPI